VDVVAVVRFPFQYRTAIRGVESLSLEYGKGKVKANVPALKEVLRHEDIHCLIKHHAVKSY
jgi:hypothetical protein